MKGKYNIVETITQINDGKVDTCHQRIFPRYFNPTRIQNIRSHFEKKGFKHNYFEQVIARLDVNEKNDR